MERFLRMTVKRVPRVVAWTGTLKNPFEMSMALGARSYVQLVLFFSLPLSHSLAGTLGFKTRIDPPYPHARR